MAIDSPLQKKIKYFKTLRALTVVCLICFVALALLIIIEAAMPGELSAKQSDFVSNILTSLKGDKAYDKPTKPSRISVSCEPHFAGEQAGLTVDFYPSGSTASALLFESSDETVATVDSDGTITFLSFGKTEITARIEDDSSVYDTTRVTCYGTNPMFISQIDMEKCLLREGERIYTHIYDSNGRRISAEIFDITSSDENVITADSSYITALKPGNADITFAHAASGFIQTFAFEVVPDGNFVIPDSFGFTSEAITINRGDVLDLDKFLSEIDPRGANACYDIDYSACENVYNLEWLNANRYEAAHAGETVIAIVSCFDRDCRASLKVNISEIAPTELRIIGGESRLVIGNGYRLRAFGDGDYVNKIIWQTVSGDAKIAEDGTVTSMRTGRSVVRATSALDPSVYADVEIEFGLFKNFKTFVRAFFGHFLLFALFGFFLAAFIFFTVKRRGIYPVLTLICGIALAVISELLQLPSVNTGRGASIRDVLTDAIGVACGIAVLSLIILLYILIKKKAAPKSFRTVQSVLSKMDGKTVFSKSGKFLSVYNDIYSRS